MSWKSLVSGAHIQFLMISDVPIKGYRKKKHGHRPPKLIEIQTTPTLDILMVLPYRRYIVLQYPSYVHKSTGWFVHVCVFLQLLIQRSLLPNKPQVSSSFTVRCTSDVVIWICTKETPLAGYKNLKNCLSRKHMDNTTLINQTWNILIRIYVHAVSNYLEWCVWKLFCTFYPLSFAVSAVKHG